MAGQMIKITPDQVRSVAAQFADSANRSREMISGLNTQIEGLSSDWAGMTQQQFYNEFQQWKNNMNGFIQMLDGINNQLKAIADRFEAADRGQPM